MELDEIVAETVTRAMLSAMTTAIEMCQAVAAQLAEDDCTSAAGGAIRCAETLATIKREFGAATSAAQANA